MRRPRASIAMVGVAVMSVAFAVADTAALRPTRLLAGRAPQAAEPRDTRPRFDIASVKPCTPNAPGGGGRGGGIAAPGRLRLDCQPFFSLMRMAYQLYADGRVSPPATYPTFEPYNAASPKAPAWTRTTTFRIEAVSEQTPPPSATMMRGPMLQTLLEERFKLKLHRESRELPVYEMVVAKGGVNVKPFQPGTCVPYDWNVDPQPPLQSGQRRCRNSSDRDTAGEAWVQTAEATTLDELAATMTNNALALAVGGVGDGRPVINKTGINGLVSFRLVYTDRDSYNAALKDQLGLELRAAKAVREFLVIDHVELPADANQ